MPEPKTCQRWPRCADIPPHQGTRHLDPRDELYDGPSTTLQVLPGAVRESARKIISESPELTPEVIDLANHILFLRDQVAHVSVDKDRSVREASRKSLDCEHHGEVIQGLEKQLDRFDESGRRSEAGRLALLGFLFEMDKAIEKPREDLTVAQLLGALKAASKSAHAAHQRAWRR